MQGAANRDQSIDCVSICIEVITTFDIRQNTHKIYQIHLEWFLTSTHCVNQGLINVPTEAVFQLCIIMMSVRRISIFRI